MAGHNVYEAHLRDGRAYHVATPHHHDDHDQNTWLGHVIDLLAQIGVRVAANEISRILHKGRR